MSDSTHNSVLPRSLSAVIFDCDGVLVDSEPSHKAATRDELASRGIDLSESFFAQHVGMRVADQMRVLADQFGLDANELYRAREERFWQTVSTTFVEVPGSVDAVRALHETGLPIAVATSGTRRWIDHVIDRLGLDIYIAAAVSGDQVVNPKPHPEPYLVAAAQLGIPAVSCGVVEDSHRGYRSALAAGCSVVVLDRTGDALDEFDQAAAIVRSMPAACAFLLATTGRADRPATSTTPRS